MKNVRSRDLCLLFPTELKKFISNLDKKKETMIVLQFANYSKSIFCQFGPSILATIGHIQNADIKPNR